MNNTYSLIDSGNFQKLEKIGPYKIVRPSPQAIWPTSLKNSDWDDIDAYFIRNSKGSGKWHFKNKIPANWEIDFEKFKLMIKLTGFGHIGLFAEQKFNLSWIYNQIKTLDFQPKILNLFAYTGILSLCAIRAGAFLTHLDAAKGVVEWAKHNAGISGLNLKDTRWIVDDVTKFVSREIKRGSTYDGIILDPPSFGRGPKNELWKIDHDLWPLLSKLKHLFSNKLQFVILSSHSPGYTPSALKNCLEDICPKGKIISSEMLLKQEEGQRYLPSGATCNWSR